MNEEKLKLGRGERDSALMSCALSGGLAGSGSCETAFGQCLGSISGKLVVSFFLTEESLKITQGVDFWGILLADDLNSQAVAWETLVSSFSPSEHLIVVAYHHGFIFSFLFFLKKY